MSTSAEPENKNQPSAKTGEKKDVESGKVHSANSWETADLGDDERNKKFLRLMGASKADHQGRFIIGEKSQSLSHKHTRDKKQTEKMEKELEDQYKHTFEHRITKWSHKGLGFEDEKKPESTEENQTTEKPKDSEKPKDFEKEKEKDSETDDQSDRKRENTDSTAKNEECPPKKPKMMMNFVKSSD